MTSITIDGSQDDWVGIIDNQDDPAGDADEGFLDLGTGYVFLNQDALYFMVDPFDPTAPFVQFDIQFQADDRFLQISWGVGGDRGTLGDYTTEGITIGPTQYSLFAYDQVLEGRIDLRDIGNPTTVELRSVNVMAGSGAAWRAVERWEPAQTPFINEVDSPRMVGDDIRYELARRFQLPEGYDAELIFTPFVSRWILQLDKENGTSDIIAQYNRDGCCAFDFLGVDPAGDVWWITNPEKDLLRVTADGAMGIFASNLPMDSPAVIADSQGDVYIPSYSGIIRIYREP